MPVEFWLFALAVIAAFAAGVGWLWWLRSRPNNVGWSRLAVALTVGAILVLIFAVVIPLGGYLWLTGMGD